MTQLIARNPQGRDTGAGSTGNAVVSPSGQPITKDTDALLAENNLLLRAIVAGLQELVPAGVDLLKDVGL